MASLPSLSQHFFTTNLISNPNKEVKYRPFVTDEEKQVLLAAETKDKEKAESAIEQIVRSCVSGVDFDTELSPIDFQYLLIKIREVSKGEVFKFSWKCESCSRVNESEASVTEDFEFHEAKPGNITVGPYKIEVAIPNMRVYRQLKKLGQIDQAYKSAAAMIKTVVEGEKVYDSFTFEEAQQWIGTMPGLMFKEFTAEIDRIMPMIVMKKKVRCSNSQCSLHNTEISIDIEDFSHFLL